MKKKVLSLLTAASMLLSVTPIFTSGAAAAGDVDIEWANLKFNADASWGSQWKKAETDVVTIDTEDKVEGAGSLYVAPGEGGAVSVWGDGPSITAAGLKPGDIIEGTCWVKAEVTETVNNLPPVQIYSDATEVVDSQTVPIILAMLGDKLEDGENGWAKYKLASTGKAVSGDATVLKYRIESGTKVYHVDDISLTAVRETNVTPENATAAFEILQFEDASAFDATNSYGTFEIKTDDEDYPANKGHGALYTESSFSLWGGGAVIAGAEAGSTISGTVAFRLQQPMYDAATSLAGGSTWFRFPSIKIVKASDKTVLAELKAEDFNISEYEAQTWITVNIPSTGATFSSEDALEYNVGRAAGGAKIMIDSVTLTALLPGGEPIAVPTEVPEQTEAPEQTAAPAFTPEDATAAFDILQFENNDVFDDTNSYGTFDIKTDDPDYPAYKGHSALYSENNFSLWGGGAVINDAEPSSTLSGTIAFRLHQPMYDAKESLEGGSTWYRFPEVKIVKAADKTVLAELKAEDFNISDYEAQKWIKVDIPSTGATFSSEDALEYTVTRAAGGAKLMIDSLTLKVSAPQNDFYIDRAASSTVILDGAVSCKVVVANETGNNVTGDVIVAVYDENNMMLGVNYINDANIQSGEPTEFDVNINPASHSGEVRVMAMIWDNNQSPLIDMTDITGTTLSYDNAEIAYIGRWTDTGSCMSSSWGGAYFKTVFTGTSAALDLKNSAYIYVSVDGGEDKLYDHKGSGSLVIAEGLDEGAHTLRVASKYTFESINLESITLDNGAELREPEVSDTLIEFIGDSNTAGYLLDQTTNCPGTQIFNYSWLVGEELGAEHVHIAYTGMALSDGIYNNNIRRDVGMSVQYDKTKPLDGRNAADWDHSVYSPDLICINLGGNDANATAVPGGIDKFRETLPVFLAHLREIHPDAEIVVLIPTTSPDGTPLQSIIPEVVTGMNDSKINYYNANAWVKDNTSVNILSDNVHLSKDGNKVVANELVERFTVLLGL